MHTLRCDAEYGHGASEDQHERPDESGAEDEDDKDEDEPAEESEPSRDVHAVSADSIASDLSLNTMD